VLPAVVPREPSAASKLNNAESGFRGKFPERFKKVGGFAKPF
jgi:hypothetical protein